MSNVIDQFHDVSFGYLVRQTSAMPQLESFVKHASLEAGDADTLPASAFAWPEERRFPIHCAEHTALSVAYSKLASHLPAEVQANLAKALEIFEIPLSTFEETKVAYELSDDDYLLPDMKLFPVKTAADVKYAQHRVVEQISKLDLPHRALACANLVKKADEFKMDLHPLIQKFAGFVVSSTKDVREWIEARQEALPESQHLHKVAYARLAEALEGEPEESRDRQGLIKLASAIGELDAQSGLDRHYDRKLKDPLQTVFNTNKLASETIDLGGKSVSLKKLAALPATFWEDLGGSELSDEICPGGKMDISKLAMIVETLPLDLKVTLRAYAQ